MLVQNRKVYYRIHIHIVTPASTGPFLQTGVIP